MKNIIMIAALFCCISVSAQKEIAPAAAKASFGKAFPGATKVKWEKENGAYEVSFTHKGEEMSAIYDAKGNLRETEKEIKVTELPAAVTNYMQTHYKGIKVKGAAKITKTDGHINWEAAIKGKDVLFDENGKFIKEAKD